MKLFTDPTSASIPAPASALRLDAVFQPGRGVRRTFRYGFARIFAQFHGQQAATVACFTT